MAKDDRPVIAWTPPELEGFKKLYDQEMVGLPADARGRGRNRTYLDVTIVVGTGRPADTGDGD